MAESNDLPYWSTELYPPSQSVGDSNGPGTKISLITNSENRYEGVLLTIDAKTASIGVGSVRLLGTESRSVPFPTAPFAEIENYVIFNVEQIREIFIIQNFTPLPAVTCQRSYDPEWQRAFVMQQLNERNNPHLSQQSSSLPPPTQSFSLQPSGETNSAENVQLPFQLFPHPHPNPQCFLDSGVFIPASGNMAVWIQEREANLSNGNNRLYLQRMLQRVQQQLMQQQELQIQYSQMVQVHEQYLTPHNQGFINSICPADQVRESTPERQRPDLPPGYQGPRIANIEEPEDVFHLEYEVNGRRVTLADTFREVLSQFPLRRDPMEEEPNYPHRRNLNTERGPQRHRTGSAMRSNRPTCNPAEMPHCSFQSPRYVDPFQLDSLTQFFPERRNAGNMQNPATNTQKINVPSVPVQLPTAETRAKPPEKVSTQTTNNQPNKAPKKESKEVQKDLPSREEPKKESKEVQKDAPKEKPKEESRAEAKKVPKPILGEEPKKETIEAPKIQDNKVVGTNAPGTRNNNNLLDTSVSARYSNPRDPNRQVGVQGDRRPRGGYRGPIGRGRGRGMMGRGGRGFPPRQ